MLRLARKALGSAFGLALFTSFALAGSVPQIPISPNWSEPSQFLNTLNTWINQLNGNFPNSMFTTAPAAGPSSMMALGGFCTASGATPQTCNAQRGVVTTNSLATAASASATFVINNSLVTANNACVATIGNTTSTGTPTIAQVVTGAGTITVTIANVNTATALNNTVNINFNCLS